MEVIIKLKGKPKDNDILIYNNGSFTPIDSRTFLKFQNDKIKSLEEKNAELETKMRQMDSKLEEYHNILQIISKGEQ